MSRSSVIRFNFKQRVAYDAERKAAFHRHAHRQLRLLALALGLTHGKYDLRSNAGGIAVSGEITLHADDLYVQACQPACGHDTGILFRCCAGRRDYVGGRNHFASFDLLHEPERLAELIARHIRR